MTKFKRRTALPAQHAGFRSPTLDDIEYLARSKTEAAINVLAAIMLRETANAFARVAAANAILDRGWGKPVQALATDGGPFEMLHRIERVIVNPDNPSITIDHADEAEPPEDLQRTSRSRKKLQ